MAIIHCAMPPKVCELKALSLAHDHIGRQWKPHGTYWRVCITGTCLTRGFWNSGLFLFFLPSYHEDISLSAMCSSHNALHCHKTKSNGTSQPKTKIPKLWGKINLPSFSVCRAQLLCYSATKLAQQPNKHLEIKFKRSTRMGGKKHIFGRR